MRGVLASIDWKVLLLPGVFVVFCVLYYGSIWFYRMRVRGGRMRAVAAALAGTYTPGYDAKATEMTPQFKGTELRLARAAYNVVRTQWPLHGRACAVWMGDVGNQWNDDPLVKAVGGEIFAGFIAVEVPLAFMRGAVIRDNDRRATEQLSRAAGRGAYGSVVNLWEMLQEHSEREALLHMRTGEPDLDKSFDFRMDSPRTFSAMINEKTERMLRDHPGHIWIKDGVLLLECGDRVWTRDDFLARAGWLRDFIESWDSGAPPDAADDEFVKPLFL